MGSMVSGLADAVLGVVEGVGLSANTVARYRKCCGVVVKFCDQRDLDALSARVVDEFVACQQERARRGEIGRNRRNALVKSARMMLEFQTTGAVVWRMMSPDPDLTLEREFPCRAEAVRRGGRPGAGPGISEAAGPARFASSWPISTEPAGVLSAPSLRTTSGGSWSRWPPGGRQASATWCGR